MAVLAVGAVVATPITGGAVGPGSIDFTSATATVAEADVAPTTVNLTVQRTDGTDGAATVDYAVTGGSATPASDFDITGGDTGTLTWADGDGASQNITFSASPDNEVESDETVGPVAQQRDRSRIGRGHEHHGHHHERRRRRHGRVLRHRLQRFRGRRFRADGDGLRRSQRAGRRSRERAVPIGRRHGR